MILAFTCDLLRLTARAERSATLLRHRPCTCLIRLNRNLHPDAAFTQLSGRHPSHHQRGVTVGDEQETFYTMNDDGQLLGTAAIDKFKELVDHQRICMFLTETPNWTEASGPMSTQKVCDQGNFWFLSARSSQKNKAIATDPRVRLLYANTSANEYLSVAGKAEIIDDMAKKKELWNPIAKAWFPDGVDDKELTVVKVKPDQGHYWDTKSGKLVSTMKILAAAVTGNAPDAGVEGTISVARATIH